MPIDDILGQQGVIQVVPEAQLQAQEQQKRLTAQQAEQSTKVNGFDPGSLCGFVRTRYEIFRNHRNTVSGWSDRLLESLRTFNGEYNSVQLAEIRKFGGSEIYARIIAQKCRAASSLLRDIYLSQDRPWAVKPPDNPDVPPDILQSIDQLIQGEAAQVMQTLGKQPSASDLEKRKMTLMDSAQDAAKKKAARQAKESESRIEELLRNGGFYHGLAEFIVDLPIFPFAVMKGPVVKVVPSVQWAPGGGPPSVQMKPTLTWNRVSPFDIWFTPGVSDIENAEVLERISITRAELNDLLDLPGYNTDAIRTVLDTYGRGGLYDTWDTTDSERAALESRENPAWNRSAMLLMTEYHGNVQGRMLKEYGLEVPDEFRDYSVECWCIGNHVIKCHLNPSPRYRHPYFITSFEKVPGTPVGNSLCDLLADIQQAANATLRALVNNLSIASGPQVIIDDDRLVPGGDNDQLYPWKRWHTRADPVSGAAQAPVSFFMPTSNTDSLMTAYKELVNIADDVSAIPKYVGGSGQGNAGRTASGLAMLMGNASKILQTVSANIDRDVIEPALLQLSDLILLTDTTGILTGEEQVSVLGVNVAIQRETVRQRQLEFLQGTRNPVDLRIMGIAGRGRVLRAVSQTIGLNGEEVVPSDEELERMEAQDKQQQEQGAIAQVIQKGVNQGIEQGIKRITAELTQGEIATQIGVPGTMGVDSPFLGPPGQGQGEEQFGGGGAGGDGGVTGGSNGMNFGGPGEGQQAPNPSQGAPQTHLTGSQPGPGQRPLTPGPG